MSLFKIAGSSLTLTAVLLLQGCGGNGSKSVATSVSSRSVNSVASSMASSQASSSSSSVTSSVSVAEAQLGAENLSPDTGIATANTLAAGDFSPEQAQAGTTISTGDLPPL